MNRPLAILSLALLQLPLCTTAPACTGSLEIFADYGSKDGVKLKDIVAEPKEYGEPGPGKIKVVLQGVVKRPGTYYVEPALGIYGLVREAGEITDHQVTTMLKWVLVTRMVNGQPENKRLPVQARSKDAPAHIPLQDGDIIQIHGFHFCF